MNFNLSFQTDDQENLRRRSREHHRYVMELQLQIPIIKGEIQEAREESERIFRQLEDQKREEEEEKRKV